MARDGFEGEHIFQSLFTYNVCRGGTSAHSAKATIKIGFWLVCKKSKNCFMYAVFKLYHMLTEAVDRGVDTQNSVNEIKGMYS